MLGSVLAGFDTTRGFTITNNTGQNVYLQTSQTKFVTISSGATSDAQTAWWYYAVRNDDNSSADIFLTIKCFVSTKSVHIVPGTIKGDFAITVNFA